jgi:hypothetical protein
MKSIPIKSLPSPLLRLLPVIFEYVRLTAVDGTNVGPVARHLYVAHVRIFKTFLRTMAESAQLAPKVVEPLTRRCDSLITLRGADLIDTFSDLVEGVQSFYASDRKRIRDAVDAAPDLFRDLYLAATKPTRILAVYAEDTWAGSEKIESRLTDGCWYDHRPLCESEGVPRLDDVDVELLVPGQRPFRADIEGAVARSAVPVLVLAGSSKQRTQEDMMTRRTEYWYQRRGLRVLHAPFVPVRLYQVIDGLHLRHKARLHATSCRTETAAH